MTLWTRRGIAAAAVGVVVACTSAACADSRTERFLEIDNQADSAIAHMLHAHPKTQDLMARAHGVLIMPLVTKAGIGIGGAYGEGVLRIDGSSLDYYSSVQFNYGLQAGAQQYSYVLFFMNQDALDQFKRSNGWVLGAGIEAVMMDASHFEGLQTLDRLDVVGLVFAREGLHLGATLNGTKYTRIEG